MPSSHDRNGGNVDGGAYTGPLAATGLLPPPYVRREGDAFVILDHDGPGCLVRLFMAGTLPGETHSYGNLQLFIDGEAEPSYDAPAHELFEGKDPRYPSPLVGDYTRSSGGNWSMVPFCFKRSLEVRTTTMPFDLLGYWQANVLLVPPRTKVKPYDPGQSLAGEAAALDASGRTPARRPSFTAEGGVAAGGRLALGRLKGAGLVRHLRFAVSPFDAATLRGLRLQVTVDHAGAPQIDVPLGSAFGDGIEVRQIDSAAFGMDLASATGYLSLPIPYRRGARLTLTGSVPAHVRVEGWTAKPARGADRLYGEFHVERAPLGLDTRVLEARGSGRLAALTFDDVDGGPVSNVPPLQRWLEGDERTFIDGSRSPTFYGTGHEERFNGGYYYVDGPFTTKLGGAGPFGTTAAGGGTQSQYRVYGADAPIWSRRYLDLEEHGGGDEQPNTVEITTWSYRGPVRLRRSDRVVLGDPASEAAHRLRGELRPETLRAFFEGERDGNGTVSTVVAGGNFYPGPPAEENPEAVSAAGVRFSSPIRLRVKVWRRNTRVVLRGLFDQAAPAAVRVRVDGKPAGLWADPTRVASPSKRWLEDDYTLPPALTREKRHLDLTLTPEPGTEADLFGLEVFSGRR